MGTGAPADGAGKSVIPSIAASELARCRLTACVIRYANVPLSTDSPDLQKKFATCHAVAAKRPGGSKIRNSRFASSGASVSSVANSAGFEFNGIRKCNAPKFVALPRKKFLNPQSPFRNPKSAIDELLREPAIL